MKIQFLFILSLALSLAGCQQQDPMHTLQVSGDLFADGNMIQTISNDAHTLKIAINSNADWKVTGATEWCQPDTLSGFGNDTLTLDVKLNVSRKERQATFILMNKVRTAFRIIQSGSPGDFYYQLPVIFHVLYNNPNDNKQNIDAQTIEELLNSVNLLYSNNSPSIDMNLEFVAATHDPNGNELAEPGIERIEWPESYVMDQDKFMGNKEYAKYTWNQNQYINIFIYAFSAENVLGISHIPYGIGSDRLAGLVDGTRYLAQLPDYPHCVSINNKYLKATTWDKRNQGVVTLSHELGHYLGLFHAFSENKCDDADYCEDTPAYNRTNYDKWLDEQRPTLEDALKRSSCDGSTFVSTNIMDYDYSYSDRFTLNQYQRIRSVLENSPLIPGPKVTRSLTRNAMEAELPEVRTIK